MADALVNTKVWSGLNTVEKGGCIITSENAEKLAAIGKFSAPAPFAGLLSLGGMEETSGPEPMRGGISDGVRAQQGLAAESARSR